LRFDGNLPCIHWKLIGRPPVLKLLGRLLCGLAFDIDGTAQKLLSPGISIIRHWVSSIFINRLRGPQCSGFDLRGVSVVEEARTLAIVEAGCLLMSIAITVTSAVSLFYSYLRYSSLFVVL
jgi:hypothetical protein